MKEPAQQPSDRGTEPVTERRMESEAAPTRTETARAKADAAARRRAAWAEGKDTATVDARRRSASGGFAQAQRPDDFDSGGPAASVLDLLPQAVFCLGDKACVLWMNAAARSLLAANRGLRLYRGRLAPSSRQGQRALATLADLTSDNARAPSDTGQEARGVVLPVELIDGSSLALLARPIESQTHGQAIAGARLLVFVTDPNSRITVPPRFLMQLYGLTPAEARVAAAVAAGIRLPDYADQQGIGVGTVRYQLKRILEKTGTRSQADLVRLIFAGPAALLQNHRFSDRG